MIRALALAALLFASAAHAADDVSPAPKPSFALHRFDEDWRGYCARQDRPSDASTAIKCIEMGAQTLLTLGGELRERIEWRDRDDLAAPRADDLVALHRALVHGDLHAGAHLRLFAQLALLEQSGRAGGPSPLDVDRVDLAQGFVDLSHAIAGGTATLRLGRQEIALGSSRLVAVRDSPNARRAFDGVRGFWRNGAVRVDALYVQPITLRPGSFDDATDRREALWGLDLTAPLAGPARINLYYLGFRNRAARFDIGTGQERRHSFGARLFGAASGWDWDVEAVVQVGRFGARRIRAWTVASDVGFTLPGPLRPRLGLKADIASGDRDPADGRLETFNALFPKFPYFSDANLIAPANFIDLHPSVQVRPARNLSLGIGVDALWRQTVGDAVYVPPFVPIPGTSGRRGRATGTQFILDASWQLAPGVTTSGQFVRFRAADANPAIIRDATFVYTSVTWKL